MKKTYIAATVMLLLLIGTGVAAAHSFSRQNAGQNTQVEQMLESGTYQDLVAYRAKTGFNVMPMVQDEEGFKLMQELHKLRESYWEQNGYTHRNGVMMGYARGYGQRGFGGCPFMD